MGYVRTTGKDLDIISIDDLYNNFKIVEQEVKRTVTASSSLGSQNIAFLSSPDSTNEVDTANNQVSIVSTPVSTVSTHDNTTNLSDATVYVFLANLPNWSQLMHEDLEQIHEDDLKEIDLKWQLALLSMRAKRYFQRTGNPSPQNQESRPRNQDNSRKTVNVEDTSSKVMVAIDGAGFDWSYMADDKALTNMALMALSDSEFNKSEFDIATYKRGLASIEEQLIFYKKNEVMFYDQIAVLKRDASFRDLEINALNLQIEETNSLVFALQGDPQDALKDQGYFENQLGKFDGKLDEWIFVGYSTISKAFRVYNTRTRKVKENLHITFLENKPMIAGGRPEWLFDVDALSESMNYAPVPAGTNSNDFADNSLFDSSSQDSDGHNKDKHGPSQESECDNQERPNTESSTKIVNTDGLSINIANANDNTSSLNINTVIPPVNTATPTYADYPSDPLMPNLEDSGILDDAYDDRDKGAEAEYNNLETIISVSPIPSTRVHKDHPKEQIISEVHSVVQTRKMAKQNEEGCSLS
nr:ribonuclease H-like domain-containing protein [Tanacetum cinerariifolium]